LRPWQVDGGGSVALLRPTDLDHGDRRQAHHRRRRIRIPDGAQQRSAGGDAFLHPALQAVEPRGKLHHNFHNLLPFRGADVRDALAWSKYLSEALQMWGGKAEAMCGQHHWPVWGKERIDSMIRQQRDPLQVRA
jgi:alkyl sulfatase BDS1-like metallo-beta-lactamase superfamily hydrolase